MEHAEDLLTEPVINKSRERYLRRSGLPLRFQGKFMRDLENVSVSVLAAGEELVSRMQTQGPPYGRGLILWGPPGTGKTTIAAAILSEALCRVPRDLLGRCWDSDAKRPGCYMTYADLIQTHKDSWNKDLEDEPREDATEKLRDLYFRNGTRDYWNTRLLVLDDVGKEHKGQTEFTVNALHDLFRSRYDKSAPTIVTTNLEPHQWADVYGVAMGSFIKEAFESIKVGGVSRR